VLGRFAGYDLKAGWGAKEEASQAFGAGVTVHRDDVHAGAMQQRGGRAAGVPKDEDPPGLVLSQEVDGGVDVGRQIAPLRIHQRLQFAILEIGDLAGLRTKGDQDFAVAGRGAIEPDHRQPSKIHIPTRNTAARPAWRLMTRSLYA